MIKKTNILLLTRTKYCKLYLVFCNKGDIDMNWCPKCKKEYDDSIKECENCNVELLEGNADDYVLLLKDNNEEAIFTVYNHINETTDYNVQLFSDYDKNEHEIYVLKEDEELVKKIAISFLDGELEAMSDLKNDDFEMDLDNDSIEAEYDKSATYISAKDKFEERRSSAFSTLVIGILGLVYMGFDFAGFGIFELEKGADILFKVTMTSVFGIFTLVGIITYINSNKLKASIKDEENLINDLKKFFDETITAEEIDSQCNFEDDAEELKYFERQVVIKAKIQEKFGKTDDKLVDQFIDEYYPLLFNNDEQ